ncbi:MAG: Spy/CpxP family protein refolding chaperone [Methylomicrobium sp.]|nr:Spy/CpxP family protein refolding chaperone [Methylomicrobium sp.]
MNKKIIAIAMALALPLTAAAFPPGSGKGDMEGRHGQRIERLAKDLDLTEEQRTQLESIFKEQHEKYRAIHEETRGRMQEVLNEEQMQKMEALKQQRHEKWQEKRQEKRQERRQERKSGKTVDAQ